MFDDNAQEKKGTARKLVHKALQQQCGSISSQSIQEFNNVSIKQQLMSSGELKMFNEQVLCRLCRHYPYRQLPSYQ